MYATHFLGHIFTPPPYMPESVLATKRQRCVNDTQSRCYMVTCAAAIWSVPQNNVYANACSKQPCQNHSKQITFMHPSMQFWKLLHPILSDSSITLYKCSVPIAYWSHYGLPNLSNKTQDCQFQPGISD